VGSSQQSQPNAVGGGEIAAPRPLPAEGTLARLLHDAHLQQFAPYLEAEGYAVMADFLAADAAEIEELLQGSKMKRPQQRRFKALIDNAKT
jgi:hypothetical protein